MPIEFPAVWQIEGQPVALMGRPSGKISPVEPNRKPRPVSPSRGSGQLSWQSILPAVLPCRDYWLLALTLSRFAGSKKKKPGGVVAGMIVIPSARPAKQTQYSHVGFRDLPSGIGPSARLVIPLSAR